MNKNQYRAWVKNGNKIGDEVYTEGDREKVLDILRSGIILRRVENHGGMNAHAIWSQSKKYPEFKKAIDEIRQEVRLRKYIAKEINPYDKVGELYGVRIGDRIKLGWNGIGRITRTLDSYKTRIGNRPPLLFHLPNKTRNDERLLHSQLELYRVQGTKEFFYATVSVMAMVEELRHEMESGRPPKAEENKE